MTHKLVSFTVVRFWHRPHISSILFMHTQSHTRDKHLFRSIIKARRKKPQASSLAFKSLSIVMNYNVIMQSSINKSTRITIQNLSADIATFNGFSMAQLICRRRREISIRFCRLSSVVTFNFKFSKIITALLTFNSFFLFQFSSAQLGSLKIYCVRMDGKFVSGTERIVRVHLALLYWIDYIQRILQKPNRPQNE